MFNALVTEAQDLLLDRGNETFLANILPDVVRWMAQRCPVFTDIRMLPTVWVFGTYTEATQLFTDATATMQTPSPVSLTTLTDGDGFLLGVNGLCETVAFTMGQLATGGTPVWEWTYWDGKDWQALSLLKEPDFTQGGIQTLAFVAPEDWRQRVPTGVTFPDPSIFNAERFWLRLRATTAPTTQAPQAASLQVLTALYPLSEETVHLLSAVYYPGELEPVPVASSLDLWQNQWQTLTGTPGYITQDLDATHRVRLIPIPTALGQDGIPIFSGLPGATVGANNLVLFVTRTPEEAEMPSWFEGLLVYALGAREARRLGETQDVTLAESLDAVTESVVTMLQALWVGQGLETSGAILALPRRE